MVPTLLAATITALAPVAAGDLQDARTPPGPIGNTVTPFDPVSFLSLERFDNITVSGNGAARAVTIRSTDWQEDAFVETITLLDADGALAQQLELPSEPDSFAWSPSGDRLALDLDDEDSGSDQVFIKDLHQDTLTRLTHHPEDVGSIRWGPQGQWIYYLAEDSADTIESAQRRLTHIVEPFDEDFEHRHLWRVSVETGESHRLTGGRFSVIGYDVARSGAIMIRRASSRRLNDRADSEVWVAARAGASFVRITRNDVSESEARISPDGQRVAWRARATLEGAAYVQDKLFVHDLSTDRTHILAENAAFEVDGLAWTSDGRSLVLEVNAGLRSTLLLMNANSGRYRELSIADHRVLDWTLAAEERAAYAILGDADSLGDVWRLSLDGDDPERLTHAGSNALTDRLLPTQEPVRWRSVDGHEIEGLYIPPLQAHGGPAPLVVFPHGGPRTSDQFDSLLRESKFAPVLSANGYGVLFVNYRGGTGYGDEFMRGMHREYFRIAHHDVLTGVDTLVEQGRADPDHLVIMGWSAGGHMTNKILTETDRFAAALSGAGVIDFAAHHLTSDLRWPRRLMFDAQVWEEGALESVYYPQSLIGDLRRISTPTLIMTGENDERVHPSQSIMLHRALLGLDVETELYVLPNTAHSPVRPSLRLFRINAALDWFARHRDTERPGWAVPPVQGRAADLLRRGAAALTDGGSGAFLFEDWDGPALPVFFHVPENADADSPIVMVAHGTRRNGEVYRDQWIDLADAGGFIVVAPQFGATDFPGSRGYNMGAVFDGDAQRPAEQWAFSAIDPLFESVRDALGSNRTGYTLYGHSAGSQFTHRHLFWLADSLAERHIAANAGWYTMPDEAVSFPYGLGESGLSEDDLAAALQRDVIVLLGSEDNDPDHASLRRTRRAMDQGPHRFARGQAFFNTARERAEALGVPFGWRLEVVDGARHSNTQMAVGAAQHVE